MRLKPFHVQMLLVAALAIRATFAAADEPAKAPSVKGSKLFEQENLMAWCIVPFDSKRRGPEERAAMLEKLKFSKFAYDYRAEHIPTFDAEGAALTKHSVELSAWGFPTELNAEARRPGVTGHPTAADDNRSVEQGQTELELVSHVEGA